MKYVVGYINLSDYELILEEIMANSPHEALWNHSKMRNDDRGDMKERTKGMGPIELHLDFDILVSVLELS